MCLATVYKTDDDSVILKNTSRIDEISCILNLIGRCLRQMRFGCANG